MKKRCMAFLLAMALACTTGIPVMADEYDPEIQMLSNMEDLSRTLEVSVEDTTEAQEMDSADNDGESQKIAEGDTFEESVDILSQDEGEQIEIFQDEDSFTEENSKNEAEILDEVLLNDEFEGNDVLESEEDTEDEFEIATLAVTNGFGQGSDGAWYYYKNGQIDTSVNSVIKDSEKLIDETASWWYVVGGKVQTGFTGLADYKNDNGWWYIENGKVTFTYNGFSENKNGKWYIENGKVTFGKNSVIKDTIGAIGTKGTWWYVVGSKVQTSFTGLANYKNENGWWYIENGKVTFNHTGVEKNKNGWFYVTGSKVDFSYNGFASNNNGKWYLENGKVTFNKNSVIKDANGAIGAKGTWWYVVGSKVQTGFTGLADYSNANGWWYIKNGKVTFDYTGIAKNKNGWFYCKDSKVLFDEPLALAAKFVGAHTSASASNSEKLSSAFSYMRNHYSHVRYYNTNPSPSDFPSYVTDYFTNLTGNCYCYAASVTCIAKVLGYETRTVVGKIDTGNGLTAHGWCEVKVDGTWYILDVGFNVYMKTMAQYPHTLEADARYTLNVVNGKAVWQ